MKNTISKSPRVMATADVATATGFHANTIRKWALTKKGPITPIGKRGRCYIWRAADVNGLVEFLEGGAA